jgi:hypothetical protein
VVEPRLPRVPGARFSSADNELSLSGRAFMACRRLKLPNCGRTRHLLSPSAYTAYSAYAAYIENGMALQLWKSD